MLSRNDFIQEPRVVNLIGVHTQFGGLILDIFMQFRPSSMALEGFVQLLGGCIVLCRNLVAGKGFEFGGESVKPRGARGSTTYMYIPKPIKR